MHSAHALSWKIEVFGEVTGLSCRDLIALLNAGRYALIAGGAGHQQLATQLSAAGYDFAPAVGVFAGRSDHIFIVQNPDERDMIALARKYRQDSLVIGEGGQQRMIFTEGPHAGEQKAGKGWRLATGREGQFTQLETTDGQTVRFALEF